METANVSLMPTQALDNAKNIAEKIRLIGRNYLEGRREGMHFSDLIREVSEISVHPAVKSGYRRAKGYLGTVKKPDAGTLIQYAYHAYVAARIMEECYTPKTEEPLIKS